MTETDPTTNDLAVDLAVRVLAGRDLTEEQAGRVRESIYADITAKRGGITFPDPLVAYGGWRVPTDQLYETPKLLPNFELSFGEDERITVEGILGQAIGAASMAWSTPPAGIFDSEWATEVARVAVEAIEDHYREPDAEGPMEPEDECAIEGESMDPTPSRDKVDKLLRKAAKAVKAGDFDAAEQYRKIAEARLQWGL